MDDVCAQVPHSLRRKYLAAVHNSLEILGRGPDPILPLQLSDTLKHVNPADEDALPVVRCKCVGINQILSRQRNIQGIASNQPFGSSIFWLNGVSHNFLQITYILLTPPVPVSTEDLTITYIYGGLTSCWYACSVRCRVPHICVLGAELDSSLMIKPSACLEKLKDEKFPQILLCAESTALNSTHNRSFLTCSSEGQ